MYQGSITDVAGVLCGQVSDPIGCTGCTALVFPAGAVAGVDVRGAAPGTRETDLLRPGNLVERVHAILLCGGSAFGLDAAGGAMKWLEEHDIGFETGFARVPIVPAAVLYDLGVGDARARPDAAMGYEACKRAGTGALAQGAAGAGCGATVGKALGPQAAMAGGIGTASMVANGVCVAAIVAVNAFGDVLDYRTGRILAGARLPDGSFPGVQNLLTGGVPTRAMAGQNTTIGLVATDAALDKAQANRLASAAHDGLAWAVRPAHTQLDGDTLFAVSAGEKQADFHVLCAMAAEVVARAIANAVEAANSHD